MIGDNNHASLQSEHYHHNKNIHRQHPQKAELCGNHGHLPYKMCCKALIQRYPSDFYLRVAKDFPKICLRFSQDIPDIS